MNLRFSIVVPAHDEENYLGQTLEHLAALAYPTESYQVIVVENGSTDRTLEVAKRHETGNVSVVVSPTVGVSAAKNVGIAEVRADSDWVVFLDADTVLLPAFLTDLDAFLRRSTKLLSVGTTKVLPLGGGRAARAWFAYYDVAHRLGKGSYAIQIARRSLLPGVAFDERLAMGEDLLFIRQAMAAGKFFFLPTRTVHTSTRRFDSVGYWRLFAQWTFVAVLPARVQKLFGYRIVR